MHLRETRTSPTLFRNEAGWDRALRLLLGLAMLAFGASGWLSQIGSVSLLIFGWVPLLTAIAGWCPIYSLLGINTFRRRRRSAAPPSSDEP